MSLADDVVRARKVDEATLRIATLVAAGGGPAEDVAYAVLRDELHRLAVENERLRDALHDIAHMSPDMAETEGVFVARKAICTHEKYERNSAGKMQCAWCWNVEGET